MLSILQAKEIRFTSVPDLFNWNIKNPEAGWEDSLDWFFKTLKAEGPDFTLNAGDLMDARWFETSLIETKTEEYWPGLLQRYAAHDLPVYIAPGDHEYGDDQGLKDSRVARVFGEQMTKLLGMPTNGPDGHEGRAYWVREGNLLLITLDTFEDEGKAFGYTVGEAQLEWFEQVVAQHQDAEFIIVQGHLPIVGPVRSQNSSASMLRGGTDSKIWKAMVAAGVDVYLCGEHHRITTHKKDGIWQVVHGALWGTQKDLNYLKGLVKPGSLELELREFRVDYSGGYIQDHPHREAKNKPREIVTLSEETMTKGPKSSGTLVIQNNGGIKKDRVVKGWFARALNAVPAKIETFREVDGAPKVLYVTHEPGTYHDYIGQREEFEKLASENAWNTDILSGGFDGLLDYLSKQADFAKSYDVVIYNVCMANTKNLEAAYNMIRQTKEHGVDTLLIHGALHTFWHTFSERVVKGSEKKNVIEIGEAGAVVHPSVLEDWERKHPNKEFPIWGDLCGIASHYHVQVSPIYVSKAKEHVVVDGVASKYKTGNDELYMQYYRTKAAEDILFGEMARDPSKKATILWESEYGKGRVMGFTLGHFTHEWKTANFRSVLRGCIEYLAH